MIIVKVLKITKYKNDRPYMADIYAFSDTKEEVVPGATYEGLPEGCLIEAGSFLMTANGKIASMKSDGTWNWMGEEEG